MVCGVRDADVMDEDWVVPERRVNDLTCIDSPCRQCMAEVSDPERPFRRRSLGAVVVEGADHLAVDVQVPVAASLMSVRGIQRIDPLGYTVLASELGVAVIEGVRLGAVVPDLAPRVGAARQLRLAGQGICLLVDRVAVAREAKVIHYPAPEVPAPVGRGDLGKDRVP